MFDAIRNTFSIKGRAKRSEFNYFMFLLLVFSIIFSSILNITSSSSLNQHTAILIIILSITGLFLSITQITVSIRRLHDLGRTGWFVLLLYIPLINLVFIFYLMFAVGSDDKNNYDENSSNKESIKSKSEEDIKTNKSQTIEVNNISENKEEYIYVENKNSIFKRIYTYIDNFFEEMFGMGSKSNNPNDIQIKNNKTKDKNFKGP